MIERQEVKDFETHGQVHQVLSPKDVHLGERLWFCVWEAQEDTQKVDGAA